MKEAACLHMVAGPFERDIILLDKRNSGAFYDL